MARNRWNRFGARPCGWRRVHVFGETLGFSLGCQVFDSVVCRFLKVGVSGNHVANLGYRELRAVV